MSGLISRVAARACAAVVAIFVGLAGQSGAVALADTAGSYGDPARAAQYWAPQSFGNNCVLMSVAGVVGQITGHMPSEQEIVEVAKSTPSIAEQGKPVYTDPSGDGADTRDIGVLLAHYGIHAVTSDDAKGQTALAALENALGSRHAVMIAVSSGTIWDGEKPKDGDHEVVVTGVDAAKGIAHLNDSGAEDGSDEQVPMTTFMRAWQGGDFEMTVTRETVQ
ncbi:hypothetical protein [Mycobacterium sp. 94-17]|uniref:hypothetical protein n=1 Tax=Mycobacterium sp. 94-17 TaxID=2986147 RepID=UPI002D1F30E7|nr:hypothetical protein [Mycobacterium sp. 94-17]MEB4208436.1 hypothetical protein [Mycobacterium sp. 94-17]